MIEHQCHRCDHLLNQIAEMHVELDYLRNIRDEKVRSDREYMTWSLGGGMVEAVFAGMRLREEAGQ